MTQTRILVHGTAVAFGDRAVLLRGPSGAGKSDLALRLLALTSEFLVGIGLPAGQPLLVADDQVWLQRQGDCIDASPPETIRGQIEVRGIGIITVPRVASAAVTLVVDLVSAGGVQRMPPEEATADLLGVRIAATKIYPFETSAPLKVVLALFGRSGASPACS